VIRAALHHFVAVTGIVALAAYACVYGLGLANPPIRSDGRSYYVYLPAWVLDADPTFETAMQDCCGGHLGPGAFAFSRWPATGHWVNAVPMGVAVQMFPFFLAAHALTRWSNLPHDGFSLYYQHLVGLGGLVYFLAGLAVLRRMLMRHFSDGVVLATLVSITFGTNLFHYGVFDSAFSHAYSFFLITALVSLTERWWADPTWPVSLTLSVVGALVTLTRHPNVIFLAIVPLYGLTRWRDAPDRLHRLWQRRGVLGAMAGVMLLCMLPQLALYKIATGHWIVNAYSDGTFHFASPHLLSVLFSVQKGLFFWSPVLMFAVLGFFVARGWERHLVIATAFVLALDTYLIASWHVWWFGGSYGHRGFTDSFGLLAIFLAAFFAWSAARPRLRPLVACLATAAVALSVVQMLQYWLGIIPTDSTTWPQYRALFLTFR
jgi:hypothetical protein